ncbi:uncharacterized protein K441DRAFT_680345 [Cenococcum geophilum 1.58]|uniref:uncharacterized protein n=1 Tax=Cenococcum geophilum 1.58 TaxID=794803 RepID=UPI00358FD21E|nr:hypothetical protein K441DRAFT_680345 [Cenococcum geophilum 1.58]
MTANSTTPATISNSSPLTFNKTREIVNEDIPSTLTAPEKKKWKKMFRFLNSSKKEKDKTIPLSPPRSSLPPPLSQDHASHDTFLTGGAVVQPKTRPPKASPVSQTSSTPETTSVSETTPVSKVLTGPKAARAPEASPAPQAALNPIDKTLTQEGINFHIGGTVVQRNLRPKITPIAQTTPVPHISPIHEATPAPATSPAPAISPISSAALTKQKTAFAPPPPKPVSKPQPYRDHKAIAESIASQAATPAQRRASWKTPASSTSTSQSYPLNKYVNGKKVLASYPHHQDKGSVGSSSGSGSSYRPYPIRQYVNGKKILASYPHHH